MSNLKEAVEGLELASQKNEKEIVIEFGSDRILHYVGVYLVGFLAVVAKISELAASNLSCYPAGNTSATGDFIKYATSYCWESSQIASNPGADGDDACKSANSTFSEDNLLKNASLFMSYVQWVPYGMILEALLFALPSIWWHFRVGAKLMGHLKFMKLLLNDIYNAVKPIPTGIYKTGASYDSESYYLDGWRGYEPNYKRMDRTSPSESDPCCPAFLRKRHGKGNMMESHAMLESVQSSSQQSDAEETENPANKTSSFSSLLFGEMRDRHLFSMLCFENFCSMEHHPYILSVYKLSKTAEKSSDRGFTGSKTKGILRLLCNKKNFGGRFLVKSYLEKHMFGIVISLLAMTASALILVAFTSEGWNAESFRCDIIYHADVCMICTIRRKRDMLAYLLVNLIVCLLYFVLSLVQWIFIRRSGNRSTSHYFEEISDAGSAALKHAE